jgi:hypothetical protein
MVLRRTGETNGGDTVKRPNEERIYMSLWHVGLAMLGWYEFRRTQHTTIGKVLALGMVAFHVDAAIADAVDVPCLTRRILEKLKG